jgi:SAM-dependent methyltransferase
VRLHEHWEAHADSWARWARMPDHDIFWRFSGPEMLGFVPTAGRKTLDLGCGEGRLARHLAEAGHRIVGVDASPTFVRLAADAHPDGQYLVADAAELPFEDRSFDLVVAFMSLMDIENMPRAVAEAARVLAPSGRFCAGIVHPIQSAGTFEPRAADAPFVIRGSYLESFRYEETFERDGLSMRFASMHRPLEAYFRALEAAGLLVEALREPSLPERAFKDEASARWQRVPLFLFLRALKP